MLIKKRKYIAITFSVMCFLSVLFSNALLVYFVLEQDSLQIKFLLLPIGFGLPLSIIVYVWLNRQVNRFFYSYLKQLYTDLIPDDTATNNWDIVDMNALVDQVQQIVSKRKLEIDALKDQDAFRKEFLGNIAHELKTPLFTVQGYVSTLLDGALLDDKVNKKYLNRANKGVDRLIYIVKDLDLLTQLETGQTELVFSKFDIVDHVRNVFELLEMRASKANIALEFDKDYSEPIYVHADEERIQQVFTNLIVNAVKYGKNKGTTEIRFEEVDNGKLMVHIADNGDGIATEHLPRLFERFYRVDKSGSRKQGGSGLGLSIVKHIMEAHQQDLFVESQPQIGSQFSFSLEKATPIDQKTTISNGK